ncbi:hypothetical protein [Streptomyces sp. NPDC005969]
MSRDQRLRADWIRRTYARVCGGSRERAEELGFRWAEELGFRWPDSA